MYTLEYDSAEKSFDDWGLSRPVRSVQNQGNDRFTFDVEGDFLAVDSWPWGAKIIVRIGRSGSGTSWTGGKTDFVGYRVDHFRGADASSERRQYKFESAWGFFFDKLVFQQAYHSWNNSTHTNDLLSRTQIVLGQGFDPTTGVTKQGLAAQVAEIANWVINQTTTEYGAAQVQLGDNYPDGYIPYDAVNNITCSEALKRCLRWIGGGANSTWIDHNTTPPTFHCRANSALAAVNLAATVTPEKLNVTRRDDLSPTAICLKYRVKVTDSASTYTRICEDIASEHGFGYMDVNGAFYNYTLVNGVPTAAESGPTITALRADALRFGAETQTFDFEGPAINQVTGTVTTVPFNPTDPAFWQVFCPELAQFASGTLAIVPDGNDNLYSLSEALADERLIYAVKDGSVAGFMGSPALIQRVTVTALFSGAVLTADGRTAQTVIAQPKQIQIVLTNVASGTFYTSEVGEDVPYGLAAQIYAVEIPVQYEGSYALVEENYTGSVGVGNALNITGGADDWADMAAQIQSVNIDYTEGRTTLRFGPAKHLGAGDRIDRLRAERGPRTKFFVGCNRNNDANQQVIDLTANGGSNTTAGLAINSSHAGYASQFASENAGRYWLDALDRTLAVAGTPYTDETNHGDGQAVAKLGDITTPPAPSKLPDGVTLSDPLLHPELRKRNIALREVLCLHGDGKIYYRTILASEEYSKSASDGTISGSGGGATQRLVITEVHDAYLVCKTFDNSATGILVAKGDLYRNVWKGGESYITVLGTTYTLTPPASGYDTNNYRMCFDGSTSELQQLVPTYEDGGVIYPQRVDHTGVTVSDTELTLVEPDGRNWCYLQ